MNIQSNINKLTSLAAVANQIRARKDKNVAKAAETKPTKPQSKSTAMQISEQAKQRLRERGEVALQQRSDLKAKFDEIKAAKPDTANRILASLGQKERIKGGNNGEHK